MAKISGVDIRPGNILEYEKGIWKVAKTQHTQPGKGGAFVAIEAKALREGNKLQERFRSGRLTTGYIAEEFPEGFAGATLDDTTLIQSAVSPAAAHVTPRSRETKIRPLEAVVTSVRPSLELVTLVSRDPTSTCRHVAPASSGAAQGFGALSGP